MLVAQLAIRARASSISLEAAVSGHRAATSASPAGEGLTTNASSP
jgi:hypothetical protein